MSKWTSPKDYKSRPVTVLGGGVLGRRIAACWCAAGYTVIVRDPFPKAREDALAYIKSSSGTYTAITQKKAGQASATAVIKDAVKNSWLVFECVPEKLPMKLQTFADLEKFAPADCIFATNSSSFKSGELVVDLEEETKKRTLNTHYMMPPDLLVVELMTDGVTDKDLIHFVSERHREAGLHPVEALRQSTGFVFNRIWAAIKREVLQVLEEGVSTPAAIDGVFREMYGSSFGPCQLMDQVGLDTVKNIEEHYVEERGLPAPHVKWLDENYVQKGKLGNKSDKGGLYDRPAPGTQTKLFFLNIGLDEKVSSLTSPEQLLHRGQILTLDVGAGKKPTELVGQVSMPDGITISKKLQRMFWTNMGNPATDDGTIWSAKLDGSDVQQVLEPGRVHTLKQCTIDETSQKLYFCDREGLRVFRINLDGSELETLIQNGNWRTDPDKQRDQRNWCVGIAVAPKLGKFFWTQKGHSKSNEGVIYSANIDFPSGATATTRGDIEVVIKDLPEPIDLDLSPDETILYWSDRGELPMGNTLSKKTIVGKAPEAEAALGRQILAQGLGEGIGLKFDEQDNVIYVADMVGRVWKCNPDKLSMKEKVYEGPSASFTGLALLHV